MNQNSKPFFGIVASKTVAAILSAALLLTVLWQVVITRAAPAADCSDGNFFGTYETNDVTLSGDLYVTSDVTIRNNVTLTITAGSDVTLCGEYEIHVTGGADLLAVGTLSQPITFMADIPATNWDTISFTNQGEHSILRHVTLNDGGGNDPGADNAPISILNNSGTTVLPSPTIDNVTINDSGAYGLSISLLVDDPTPPAITNVSINNSANAAILADAEALGGLGHGNSFSNNQPNVVRIRSGGNRLQYSQQWRNPGVPVEVLGDFTVAAEASDPPATLTIDPGLIFLMYPQANVLVGSSLGRRGSLEVNGTEADPVVFTHVNDVSAPWGQLRIHLYPDTAASLNHMHFSYGGDEVDGMIEQLGSGAVKLDHVSVQNSLSAGYYGRSGQVSINNSSFEMSATGLEFFSGSSAIIRNSTIANNVTAGITTTDNGNATCIDAIGNYWGANNGPADGDGEADACGHGRTNGGSGGVVSNGVRYDPWLPGEGALQNRGRIVPDKFYIVTDGVDSAQVEVTLLDAQGVPLADRQVQLRTTLGNVQQPGGVTDGDGRVTAVITGTTPGYAYLTAHNHTDDTPVAGIGGVTFWQGNSDAGGLISADGTPYASPELLISGKPYQVGFPVDMQVPMRNGNPVPVDVTVIYGVSGLSVGTEFTPVYTASETLQPGQSWDASGVWLPASSGHRCVQAAITVDDGHLAQGVRTVSNSTLQQNTNQDPCNPDNLNPHQVIPKRPGGPIKVAVTFYRLYNLAKKNNECIDTSLQFTLSGNGDERDYETIVSPPDYSPPLILADSELTQAQADALNDLAATAAGLLSLNQALGATAQRMNWASQAGDLYYLDLQYGAYQEFAIQYADRLDELVAEIETLLAVTPDANTIHYLPGDFQATRDELVSSGFDAETDTFYQQTGLSPELIAQLEADLVTNYDQTAFEIIPWNLALNNIRAEAQAIASRIRATYPPQTLSPQGDSPVVVRPLVYDFNVGHPFDNSRDIDLVVRPLNLPLNWTYELSSPAYTLAADEVVTATLTLYPGGRMLAGDLVQVAVEGYVEGELIGGIIMEHNTPSLIPRPGHHAYLPLVFRP